MKYKIGDIVQVKNRNDNIWKSYIDPDFEIYFKCCGKIGRIIAIGSPNFISLNISDLHWLENELILLSEIRKEKLKKINSDDI